MALAIGALALTLASTSAWGAGTTQRFRVPQEMSLPISAVGLSNTGTNANDWVVTAFYYPSATINGTNDLFKIPVFGYPVGEVTPLVEGFFVFHDGNPFPVPQVMHNAPGAKVEIWFTPAQNFATGMGGLYPPFTWTVDSMIAEGSIVGYADSFIQTWEAGTTMDNNTIVASGVMRDQPTTFWVKTTYAIGGLSGRGQPLCMVHFGP